MPDILTPELAEFIREQAKGARYVFGVCTGSWTLAELGILDGRKATTNKSAFKNIKVRTEHIPVSVKY